MKKLLTIFTALLLLFAAVGSTVVEAKSFSSGARSSSSFSSSKSTSITSKSSKINSAGKTNKASKAASTSTPTFKQTPKYTEPRAYAPASKARYEGKSYYSGNGFATTLATSIGTYLLLDAITDDGDPVYIDSETGEVVDVDSMNVQPLETEATEGMTGLELFTIFALIVLIFGGVLFAINRF